MPSGGTWTAPVTMPVEGMPPKGDSRDGPPRGPSRTDRGTLVGQEAEADPVGRAVDPPGPGQQLVGGARRRPVGTGQDPHHRGTPVRRFARPGGAAARGVVRARRGRAGPRPGAHRGPAGRAGRTSGNRAPPGCRAHRRRPGRPGARRRPGRRRAICPPRTGTTASAATGRPSSLHLRRIGRRRHHGHVGRRRRSGARAPTAVTSRAAAPSGLPTSRLASRMASGSAGPAPGHAEAGASPADRGPGPG